MDLSDLFGDDARRRKVKKEYEMYSELIKYTKSLEINKALKIIEIMLNVIKNIEMHHKKIQNMIKL